MGKSLAAGNPEKMLENGMWLSWNFIVKTVWLEAASMIII